jgi:hypothetical protein
VCEVDKLLDVPGDKQIWVLSICNWTRHFHVV